MSANSNPTGLRDNQRAGQHLLKQRRQGVGHFVFNWINRDSRLALLVGRAKTFQRLLDLRLLLHVGNDQQTVLSFVYRDLRLGNRERELRLQFRQVFRSDVVDLESRALVAADVGGHLLDRRQNARLNLRGGVGLNFLRCRISFNGRRREEALQHLNGRLRIEPLGGIDREDWFWRRRNRFLDHGNGNRCDHLVNRLQLAGGFRHDNLPSASQRGCATMVTHQPLGGRQTRVDWSTAQ